MKIGQATTMNEPSTFRVVVRERGPTADSREHRAAILAVGRAMSVAARDVEAALAGAPITLPARLPQADADALAASLRQAGATVEVEPVRPGPAKACAAHPKLDGDERCATCGTDRCVFCGDRCVRCSARAERSNRYRRIRIAVLLAILAGVLVYAWHDVTARRSRNDWDRTLRIALVTVRGEGVGDEACGELRARAAVLEDRLASEMQRHRPGSSLRPFALRVLGPTSLATAPPTTNGDGVLDAARYTWALRRWVSDVDQRAGVDADAFDVRIYIVARQPALFERALVEGQGQQGGRVGIVEVELDRGMVDLALVVAAHELMHTLGAIDTYDAAGRTSIPEGLAEPERGLAQRYVEIMARNRPTGGGEERVPETLEELAVGPATAQRIGWLVKVR